MKDEKSRESKDSDKVDDYELDSNFEFNPFVSNLHVEEKITENVEYEDVPSPRSHTCSHCGKAFSREEFVTMHREIFHDNASLVIPRFVENGEELITSFVKESTPKKKIKKSLKFISKKKKS